MATRTEAPPPNRLAFRTWLLASCLLCLGCSRTDVALQAQRDQINALHTALANRRREQADLQQRVDALETDNRQLRVRVEGLLRERERLRIECAQLERALEDLGELEDEEP